MLLDTLHLQILACEPGGGRGVQLHPQLRKFEFFRGLKISGKIFSRRYELSRDFRKSIIGVFVCKFILLVFPGGDSLLFLFYFILFVLFFPSFLTMLCSFVLQA